MNSIPKLLVLTEIPFTNSVLPSLDVAGGLFRLQQQYPLERKPRDAMSLGRILRTVLQVLGSRKRAAPPRHSRVRRLHVESLERRELLSASGILDGGFEAPAQAADGFQIAPGGSPWVFTGIAGVSANQSAFTMGNPSTTDGSQVGFIKNTGSISQSVYLDSGVYNISFQAAQRANYQTEPQQIEVLVNGADAGVITPSGTDYAACQSSNFTVATGRHMIQFEGLSPSSADSTAFIDAAVISPAAATIADGSFAQAVQSAVSYTIAPAGTPWQFSGVTGVSGNDSAFTNGNRNAPNGSQVAFIKDGGSMSESVQLATGVYDISFQAAQRANYQSQPQQIEVQIDGNPLETLTPSGTSYATYATATFSATAGTHSIEFLGLAPATADSTAFLNLAAIAPVQDAVADGAFADPLLAAGPSSSTRPDRPGNSAAPPGSAQTAAPSPAETPTLPPPRRSP